MTNARIRALVEQHGWATMIVGAGQCQCCETPDPASESILFYTIGLTDHGHPELVLSGLDHQTGAYLVNELAAGVLCDGKKMKHGSEVQDLLVLQPSGEKVSGYFTEACLDALYKLKQYYPDTGVTALQLIYPDAQGLYPWDEGYDFPTQHCYAPGGVWGRPGNNG